MCNLFSYAVTFFVANFIPNNSNLNLEYTKHTFIYKKNVVRYVACQKYELNVLSDHWRKWRQNVTHSSWEKITPIVQT